MEGRDPLAERGRPRADRPVAGEHHPIRAEDFKAVVDDRGEVLRDPRLLGGPGDDAGNLADHALPLGKPGDVALPLVRAVLRRPGHLRGFTAGTRHERNRVGVAAMVEDKPAVGTLVDQLRPVGQPGRRHAQIKAHAQGAQEPDAVDEPPLRPQLRRCPGQDMPDAFHIPAALESRDVFSETLLPRAPTDHGGYRGVVGPLAKLHDQLRLLQEMVVRHGHFHVDRFDHVQPLGRFQVVLGHEAPVQMPCRFEPRQTELREIPEVLVRVDDGQPRVFTRPRALLSPAGLDPQGAKGTHGQHSPGGPSDKLTAVDLHGVFAPLP